MPKYSPNMTIIHQNNHLNAQNIAINWHQFIKVVPNWSSFIKVVDDVGCAHHSSMWMDVVGHHHRNYFVVLLKFIITFIELNLSSASSNYIAVERISHANRCWGWGQLSSACIKIFHKFIKLIHHQHFTFLKNISSVHKNIDRSINKTIDRSINKSNSFSINPSVNQLQYSFINQSKTK